MKKLLEEINVTHGENVLGTITYIIFDIGCKCLPFNSLNLKVTYEVLIMRRKNAYPYKGFASR